MRRKADGEHTKMAYPSVLAQVLSNMYTNYQPLLPTYELFVYADDLTLAAQYDTFEEVESTLEVGLACLGEYYRDNQLSPNPAIHKLVPANTQP